MLPSIIPDQSKLACLVALLTSGLRMAESHLPHGYTCQGLEGDRTYCGQCGSGSNQTLAENRVQLVVAHSVSHCKALKAEEQINAEKRPPGSDVVMASLSGAPPVCRACSKPFTPAVSVIHHDPGKQGLLCALPLYRWGN